VELAGQIQAAGGLALLDAARVAFVRGLRVCAMISTVASLRVAFSVLATLRRMRGAPRAAGEAAPVASPPPAGTRIAEALDD
jgi:hypothetical protein